MKKESDRRILPPSVVLIFSVILLVAVGCLTVALTWQKYHSELSIAEERALSSAHVVAAHFQWIAEASDQALKRIDAAFGQETIRSSPDKILRIDEAVNELPAGFQYSVYDEAGRLRLSSVPEAVGINVADREYFQKLREGAPLVISPLLDERLSGVKVFVIARRIVRDGQFHGAASIAVPAAKLAEFWNSMSFGPHSTVSVVRTDGWLVARFPPTERTIDLSGSPLMSEAHGKESGVYHSAASPVDGKSRIVGFWQVPGWPLIATAGIDRQEALQGFWRDLYKGGLVGLPVLLLLAGGLVWVSHLLKLDARNRAELERTLDQNRFLLREVHHRVKNNLQTVASLVRLQKMPEEARASINGRISAMVAVHEHMYGSDQFQEVDVAPYLQKIIDNILESQHSSIEIQAQLAMLTLDRDKALPLGLLTNELISNALKHAFPHKREGTIQVELAPEDDGYARLVVSDNGIGYQSEETSKNMGSRLIDGFARQLKGTVETVSNSGTTVTLRFPVS